MTRFLYAQAQTIAQLEAINKHKRQEYLKQLNASTVNLKAGTLASDTTSVAQQAASTTTTTASSTTTAGGPPTSHTKGAAGGSGGGGKKFAAALANPAPAGHHHTTSSGKSAPVGAGGDENRPNKTDSRLVWNSILALGWRVV